MHVVLFSVLVTFFTTFTSAKVKVESRGWGLRDPSLDGKVSDEHLIFQADVSTKVACASACVKYDCCVAFSTSSKTPPSKKMTCRCHDSKAVSRSSTVDAPGSKTYFVDKKPPVAASSWLERPCWVTSDCPSTVANVVCYSTALKCLCQPGYYFSHCRDNCVPDCPLQDLKTKFLKYPQRYIQEHNIPHSDVDNCTTSETGQAACLQFPQCRTVDRNTITNVCFLQNGTALDHPVNFQPFTISDHHQRTCL